MNQDIASRLSEPLKVDQVDFRIQSINKGGYATLLAYKDARVDIRRLNDIFGVGGWRKQYREIKGNLFCRLYIPCQDDKSNWSWVEDVGVPSKEESEKGEASDAFKRAGFNLGIGIELYDYPEIRVKLNDDEWEMKVGQDGKERPTQTYKLKLKEWKWYSEFEERRISFLAAQDSHGVTRFQWGKRHGR